MAGGHGAHEGARRRSVLQGVHRLALPGLFRRAAWNAPQLAAAAADDERAVKLRNLHKLADREIRAKNLLEAKRALKGRVWDVVRPKVPDPVFVVGCSRSGTTITYETIAASGRFLHFGYEIPQFWDNLYGPLNNGWSSEA